MKFKLKPQPNPLKVAIACGGTGGHLFPGVAIADALRDKGHQAILVLSDKRVDREASARIDHPSIVLPSAAWQRGTRLRFAGRLVKGLVACRSALNVHQPDAVLAMGGFTSLAPVLIARLQNRRVFLHESNTVAGRAIRQLSRWADEVFLGFDCARDSVSRLECQVTGTPVRESLRLLNREHCCRELGFDPKHPVLLVTGGSQGALGINRLVINSQPSLKEAIPNIQVLHLCGLHDSEDDIRASYEKNGIVAQIHPFFNRMDLALGAADAALGRSGASFMAELAATRLPSLLIPFPSSVDGHQLKNAHTLEGAGAAFCLEESDANPEILTLRIKTLLVDQKKRQTIQQALGHLDFPDSANRIVSHILTRLGLATEEDMTTEKQGSLKDRNSEAAESGDLKKAYSIS